MSDGERVEMWVLALLDTWSEPRKMSGTLHVADSGRRHFVSGDGVVYWASGLDYLLEAFEAEKDAWIARKRRLDSRLALERKGLAEAEDQVVISRAVVVEIEARLAEIGRRIAELSKEAPE